MKFINLSQGRKAIVDDEVYALLNLWSWSCVKDNKTYYALGKVNLGGKVKEVRMHRLICNILNLPNWEVDHKDFNGLNNTKSNLRVCTRQENARNLRISRKNTSRYKGVTRLKSMNKWRAQIYNNGKYIYLGYYWTPEEAARVYNGAALKYHGEFANLNTLPIP